jgi:hypothetical protein
MVVLVGYGGRPVPPGGRIRGRARVEVRKGRRIAIESIRENILVVVVVVVAGRRLWLQVKVWNGRRGDVDD